MADQLNFTINRAVDANGDPAPGAKAYFYQSGTNTLRTVYTTEDATVAHASPVVADAQGVFPAVFATGACKVLITDAAGVTLTGYPMDPVFLVPTAATGANRITFDPTAEIPSLNVQDAIEQVQENLTAPLADLGLGVTGNAALLANLDAANTASGFYRYDGTTTGTFPAGVTAADGGIVLLWRETSAEAFMVLIPGGVAETHYKRTLTVSSWGSWVQNVIDEDSFATNSATRPPSQQSVKAYADALPRLGVDQTWQDVKASRTPGTTYQNTSGRTIAVAIRGQASSDRIVQVSVDAVTWVDVGTFGSSGSWHSVSTVVPDSHYYRVNGSLTSYAHWAELR